MDRHWINGYPTPLAHPLSPYPLYQELRKSWGISAFGSVIVEVECENGSVGVGKGVECEDGSVGGGECEGVGGGSVGVGEEGRGSGDGRVEVGEEGNIYDDGSVGVGKGGGSVG